MKKNIFNKIKAAVAVAGFIAAGLCSISCQNGLLQNPEEKIAYINPVVNTDSARTVYPTINVEDFKTISLSYVEATTEKTYAIWDTYKDFKNATIALDTGVNYLLTLSGYVGGAKFQSSAKVTPIAGNNTVVFDMSVVDIGKDSGTLELIAKFPNATKVKTNSVRLLNVKDGVTTDIYVDKNNIQSKYMEDGTQYIKYTRDSIPAGIYKYEITVTNTNNETGYVSDYVYIYEGCASAKAYDLTFADVYTLASGVYENSSDHISVSPDPDGNGVKVVLTAPVGDAKWTWAQVISSRTQIGMNIKSDFYPEPGKDSTVVYFPFGKDGEIDIFTLKFSRDKDGDGEGELYAEEKVISDSKGGDLSLFNLTSTNVYNDAELKLSTTGANIKLTKDIKTFLLEDKINRDYLDEVSINLYVRSGHTDWSDNTEDVYNSWSDYGEWYEHTSWSGSFSKENYKKLLSEDGFNLYDTAALEKLTKHDTWWASACLGFRLKDSDINFFTVDVTSDDTLYTPVKLNKYNFVLNNKNISDFENSYEEGTKVILPDYVNPDYKLLGWYDNDEFKGTPVTEVSAANNKGDKKYYGKVARVFNVNKWTDSSTGEETYNYMICVNFADITTDVKKFTADDNVKVTFSAIPNVTLEDKDIDICIAHWDYKEKTFSDGAAKRWGTINFTEGEKSTNVINYTVEDEYTVNEDTCIWFFINRSSYDDEKLITMENLDIKVEIVE